MAVKKYGGNRKEKDRGMGSYAIHACSISLSREQVGTRMVTLQGASPRTDIYVAMLISMLLLCPRRPPRSGWQAAVMVITDYSQVLSYHVVDAEVEVFHGIRSRKARSRSSQNSKRPVYDRFLCVLTGCRALCGSGSCDLEIVNAVPTIQGL